MTDQNFGNVFFEISICWHKAEKIVLVSNYQNDKLSTFLRNLKNLMQRLKILCELKHQHYF
jgi:hypothetical protein